jgi:hypothetical protein
MKPRIRLRFGIWSCATMFPRAIGCGRTPVEAYVDWQAALSASTGVNS